MLVAFVRKGVNFQQYMQNAFSRHMWGKRGSMAQDEPRKTDSFYGKIIVRYLSFECVQVDVVLLEDIPAALQMDMGRRAEKHADYFQMVMGEKIALLIRIFLSDDVPLCSVFRGNQFDPLPLDAGDLADDE